MKLLFTCTLLPALLLTGYFNATAQSGKLPVTFSLFSNGTSLPGTGYLGVFSKTIHPGFTAGTYHLYHTGEKHELFQSFKVGFFYHRFVQYGVQLYSEGGYRYLLKNGLFAEGTLGAGYIHSLPDVQQFTFKDGRYVRKKNWGRPEVMITTGIGVGYDLEKKSHLPMRIFIQYQFWLQAPFINNYVPLLPNTALHLGVRYLFNCKKNNDN